jgi:hypothetical protein
MLPSEFQAQANEYGRRRYGVGYLLTVDDTIDAIQAKETPEFALERKAEQMQLSPIPKGN